MTISEGTPGEAYLPRPRAPTSRGEFALVLGLPLLLWAVALLVRWNRGLAAVSDGQIARTLGFELLAGGLAWWVLRRRGWTLSTLTKPPRVKDVLWAVVLWVSAYVAAVLVTGSVMFLAPTAREILRTPPLTGFLSWPMVVAASTINPVYEEGLWLGYVWNGPADGRPVASVCVSIVLRTTVHAQQGWPALLAILPIGIVFSLYYARTGRLAPIIVAHALFDFVGLASLGRI